ncbi:helix-turn-helix transcriptional regulator [Streptomyces sp. NPDC006660]|uniref:helix-turn-helix domain-containing protein n=1 Tax=Streptomyces sp. NPDC006660 TaxID=3156901 RepID=UPI0033DDC250
MNNRAQETREALGARLRGYRKDAGFTSGRAFAAITGWQESKVSRIENGKQNASEDDIRVWCETTGYSAEIPDLVATVRHMDELWMPVATCVAPSPSNLERGPRH